MKHYLFILVFLASGLWAAGHESESSSLISWYKVTPTTVTLTCSLCGKTTSYIVAKYHQGGWTLSNQIGGKPYVNYYWFRGKDGKKVWICGECLEKIIRKSKEKK